MNCQRAGTNKLIETRLRVYDEALKDGATKEEAYELAMHVTRRSLRKKQK